MNKTTFLTLVATGAAGLILLSVACSKKTSAPVSLTEKATTSGVDGVRKALSKAGLHSTDAKITNVETKLMAGGTTWFVFGKIESGGFTEKFTSTVSPESLICNYVSIHYYESYDIFESGGFNQADIDELVQYRKSLTRFLRESPEVEGGDELFLKNWKRARFVCNLMAEQKLRGAKLVPDDLYFNDLFNTAEYLGNQTWMVSGEAQFLTGNRRSWKAKVTGAGADLQTWKVLEVWKKDELVWEGSDSPDATQVENWKE